MSNSQHWESVYQTKSADRVSWFQHHAEASLAIIRHTGLDKDARIIDVGAGASVLVDDLLDAGYRHLTVLDIAASALEQHPPARRACGWPIEASQHPAIGRGPAGDPRRSGNRAAIQLRGNHGSWLRF